MSSCPNCGNALPSDAADCPNCATLAFSSARAAGDTLHISGYDILGRLGEGGMGAIYLAEEKSLGRRVAIKVISGKLATEPQARARFMREARSLATVEHPNVVRVYSFGEVESHPYLAMEYVDGETLAERLRRAGTLSVDEAIRILRQILQALDAAWEKGIIHRDIKPSNVLIDRRGQVHVVDFGLAKTTEATGDSALTQAGSVLGTPYYLAPEQAQGEATDFHADVYSCGILLYEMLAGERPFEGTTPLAIVAKHIHEPLPSIRSRRKDVPNRVARLLEQMTEKKQSARASSYAELLATIDALLGITPAKPITPTQTFSTIPIESRPRYAWPLAVTAVIVLIVAAVALRNRFWKHPAATTPPSEGRFVVAVTPFYGPDADSEREGRLMAAMVERSIQSRLGEENVRVMGIDETKTPVRHNDAARALGQKLNAGVVVWGEAFALRNETEIQPHFTIIKRAEAVPVGKQAKADLARADVKGADPTAELEAHAPPPMRLEAQAPNQIELRKTSAEGVGEVVSLLATVHALYTEHAPRKALAFLDQAPRSADSLRYRADAHLQLDEKEKAASALEEVLKLEPNDAASHARLADLDSLGGRPSDAALHYKAAAASGQPYTSRYGIYHQGLLYQRETFRRKEFGSGKDDDTGYLLAVNPDSGVVAARYRMPGVIQSFTPTADGFSIGYIVRESDAGREPPRSLTFGKGHFDQPLAHVGGNLLLRMRAMKSGWVLAENFIGDVTGLIQDQPAKPVFHLMEHPNPGMPTSLQALEAALRAAIQRDPTQPWHLFFLGQTLLAEGRAEEAKTTWNEMLSRDFSVPYTNWTWMSKFFERFGQRDWADRTWEKAVRERHRIPQPVQVTTLIERLINVPVMRLHRSQLADGERAYTWLVRARSLSGMTEGEHLAAAAWTGHFRRHNDPRAESEAKFLKTARSHPFNWTAEAVKIDYAFDLWIATAFGLFASLLLITGVGLDRARAAGLVSPLRWRDPLWLAPEAIPRLWRAVLLAFAASAIMYVAIQMRIQAESAASQPGAWIGHLAGLSVLVMVFALAVRLFRLRQTVSQLRRIDRVALLIAFVLCLTMTLLLIGIVNRHLTLSSMPIGLADSIGHPEIVADLEERLAKNPTPELRYCAAVANDYAGKADRAKALYRELPNDPRAQKALAALEKGNSSPTMPAPAEVYRAYTAGYPKWLMADVGDWGAASGFHKIFNAVAWGTLSIAALILVACLFVPPPKDLASPFEPRSRWRRRLRKVGLMILPGYYDVRYRSALRGMFMLILTGFAGWFAISCWKALQVALRAPGVVGIVSAMAMPNYRTSFPLPPDLRAIDLYLAPPYASLFYGAAIISLLTLIVLHALRIRAIWNLEQDEIAPIDAPIAPVTTAQPAE